MASAELTRWETLAREASQRAYCPYSSFPVGAVVVTTEGHLFIGCNVENASYGLSMCAERNAIFNMVAQGFRSISAVLIYTPTDQPTAPCGACRQVLNEFGPNMRVISVCAGPLRIDTTLDQLLPQAFGPHNLTPLR